MRRRFRNASMPVLDAKALETDPEGMAFLRSVLRPTPDKEAYANADERPAQTFPLAPPPDADKPRIGRFRRGGRGVPAAA